LCVVDGGENRMDDENGEECGGSDGIGTDGLTYKDENGDPYLGGGMIVTDLGYKQNVDDERRGEAVADELEWWPP
jgi:hypothetical protein